MYLKKLFEMQQPLRDKIIRTHNLQGQDLFPSLILALRVELGELANEQRSWKHWSKDRKPRVYDFEELDAHQVREWNPLLEEFADGLSFILEIGIELGLKDIVVPQLYLKMAKQKSFLAHISHIYSLVEKLNSSKKESWYENLVISYLALGSFLGFSSEQIEEAYMAKNAINHKRQEQGY